MVLALHPVNAKILFQISGVGPLRLERRGSGLRQARKMIIKGARNQEVTLRDLEQSASRRARAGRLFFLLGRDLRLVL